MSYSLLEDLPHWISALKEGSVLTAEELSLLDDLHEAVEDRMNLWWQTMEPDIPADAKPDKIGELMTWAEWCDAVYTDMLIDYDGYGHAADAEGRTGMHGYLKPSMILDHIAGEGQPPASKITHVMWYNR